MAPNQTLDSNEDEMGEVEMNKWSLALAFVSCDIGIAKDCFPGAKTDLVFEPPPPMNIDELLPDKFIWRQEEQHDPT